MTFTLTRFYYSIDGIFSRLYNDAGDQIAFTLEHAYGQQDGGYGPKLPVGAYSCTRYNSPKHGYDVFVVNSVPGHSFIEFHIGNYDRDSDGCILLGEKWERTMITGSRITFNKFMESLTGINEFTLVVKGEPDPHV